MAGESMKVSAAELLRCRIAHTLRECRGHRSRARLAAQRPAAFLAAHGYSYRPADALREQQRDLLTLRAARAAIALATGGHR
jgi:hypothetical protein